jgi:hypothetical protein
MANETMMMVVVMQLLMLLVMAIGTDTSRYDREL